MVLFNLFLFTILFSTIIFLFFYLNHLHANKANKKRQLQGLSMLKKFRLLLTSIQQHRGLSMAYLNGDDTLLKRIKPLEKMINQTIGEINLEKEWLKDNLMWMGINEHWLRILMNYTKYENEYNFRQHCNLIMNLLILIEDCAVQHQLQELFSNKNKSTNFLWSQLLITAEHIGQVRAIGTSIAASKSSSSVQRIQLDYLQNCINEFSAKPNHQLDTTLIVKFLNTINNEILTSPPNMSAEEFFNLATSVIDVLLAKSDNYLNDLQESFNSGNN